MTCALIDNGSLEPAAHLNLRAVAAELSLRVGREVHAVSWKHSNRIAADALDGRAAWTIRAWLEARLAAGETEFVFIPFFVSPQGAIGSALHQDLEDLQRGAGGAPRFSITFAAGLADSDAVVAIVAERIRETIAARQLSRPAVIVVDHGGPSPVSAALRNAVAAQVQPMLSTEISALAAASMEGAEHSHNHPLLSTQLASAGFDQGDVVIAPLFLSPGRHAGPRGDLARLASAAEDRTAGAPLRCHFAGLVGTHPRVPDLLAAALRSTLANLPAETLA